MSSALETIKNFDENSLPDLDEVTLAALELFENTELPVLNVNRFRRPLVLGSEGALTTAKAIFANHNVVFANENNYEAAIFSGEVDGAYIFSASGSKHSITFAKALNQKGIPTVMVTNTKNSPAELAAPEMDVRVFPKNREPYTYNASTYMGMLLASTGENPTEIKDFIVNKVAPLVPDNIGGYEAYYILVPESASPVTGLYLAKFDEMFGSLVAKRAFTFEQTKHAKTVIKNDRSLFISIGVENNIFGEHRLSIPVPNNARLATMMAIGYYIIGQIQKDKPPYFKESIGAYIKEAKKSFGWDLKVIVE